jgi:hypothetical protein
MKAKPRIKPDTTVEQLCTMLLYIGGQVELIAQLGDAYVPNVIPAKPLIFWALSLRLPVRPPELFSSLSKNSTARISGIT